MPPATPATKVSLRELADLAIGTPEVGAVNFTALHTLIVAMLKNLKLHDTVIDFQTLSPEGGRSLESLPPSSQSSLPRVPQSHPPKERRKTLSRSSAHTLESQVKELEGQVQDLTRQLKTVDSQMQIIGNHVQQITSVESDFEAPTVLEVKDLAVLDTEKARIRSTQVQKDIRKELSLELLPRGQGVLSSEGVGRASCACSTQPFSASQPVDLLHDVVKDVNILKEAYQKAQELKPQDVLQRIEELEKLIRERDDFLEYMGQKLTLVPSREEVTMVTWEELEKAITDGWKASQVGSETAVGVSKRKMQSSLTSDLISSGVSTKYASTDHIPDSAGGPGQALPGSSATGHLFEAIAIRDRSKGSFIPGREQHPRAHDEANTSRFYQPPVAQFRTESDPHRSRERFTSGYPRREMHTSPTQQELPWARDQPSGQGQVYLRPDHQELGLPGMDQLGPLYPGPIPPDVLPINMAWHHLVQIRVVWRHLVQNNVIWRHLVQIRVVWHNQEQSNMAWCHLVLISVIWRHLAQGSLVCCSLESVSLGQILKAWSNLIRDLCTRTNSIWYHLARISKARHTQVQFSLVKYILSGTITGQGIRAMVAQGPRVLIHVARSRDSLSFLHQVSSEKSGTQSERHDSLEKLAPNFPIALETFRLMGELIGLYMELKESLKDLDEEKSGQTDAEKIQYLFTQMVKKILPPDLQEQMKTIKALAKEVHQEKAKVEKMQRILEGDGEQVAGKELKAGQLGLQLGLLRITITDIEKELADLRDSQEQGKAAMENSVAEASLYLQDQLDKLRMIIESMLASSSTLLSLSMTPHKPLTVLAPGQIHPEATCPACSLDLSHQVSTLVQRYEQLQEMVSNLAASRPSRKAKLQSQDEELLGHVQSAILQVQGDCEKLNITTSNLLEDHRQKQKDIDVLYQGLEKLEKNANREHLQMEIDVKADKSALASKVSRVEFDAATEQLNHMMQGLMAKLSGQERDWQKLLDKLLAEMDMKLDRLELDPVKQALEDRWKSLREQLKEHSPLYQADEAAAMRRIIPVTPVGHPLPGHRSTRPYTVFELEQVRQQSRNLKLGSCFPRGDQSPMEQSVGHLRTMHSKMLLDIEKVQIHFGGSVKASSQMIRELRQAHCLSSPCFKRVPDSADYTYSTMSRRCGGSHTLTYPYRRNRLQHPSQGAYAPENQIAMKHDEVDILGLDGHIYKGRMDTRLPGILTKDREHPASGMMKYKAKQCRPRGNRQQPLSDNSQLPSRPQSAQMLAGNNSVSSRQQQDRPVSSAVDPLAQSDMAPPPSPNLQGSLPGELERNTDMLPPGEGLEEPTRGPRSTTGQ
ncbi:Glutamine-rich protein 2 [Fukomys damarensis]|uniref:Glutamine-rich protein 2 n=1 Tax=Fukomys damarensis TaxID=885580 RepID=A0A091DX43_FUKDA|nr:Glutamine-rich protein 2 [Fukomys damarensis]